MDIELLDQLKQGNEFVQPYLASDGRCLVLGVSQRSDGFNGVWQARAFERGPLPSPLPSDWSIKTVFRFELFVSHQVAQSGPWQKYADGTSVQDLHTYFCRLAMAHLKKRLDKAFQQEGTAELRLISTSPDAEWQIPVVESPDQTRKRFRADLLHFLSDRYSETTEQVAMTVIYSKFCVAPQQIEVVLNNLQTQKLVVRTVLPGVRITDEGMQAAEMIERLQPTRSVSVQSLNPTPPRNSKYDVFLSYAREDEADAIRLKNALEARHVRVWFDLLELRWGGSLTTELNRGLNESTYGVLLISHNYMLKNWTKAELNTWLHKKYDTDQNILIPVRLNLSFEELEKYVPLLEDILSGELSTDADEAAHQICLSIGKYG